MKRLFRSVLIALQFCTRIPIRLKYEPSDSLAESQAFFPVVGLLLALFVSLVHHVLMQRLDAALTSTIVLLLLVLLTGALHEDGLADAADGLGGGWTREQALTIMRDSRVGSYGAIALVFSLLLRWELIARLPATRFLPVMITAQVLCRWSTLPLSYWLPPAREQDGQGARIAQQTSIRTLVTGSVITLLIVTFALGTKAWKAAAVTILVCLLSGLYYRHRLGGVTGDCFGTTNQITEIAMYLVGVLWL